MCVSVLSADVVCGGFLLVWFSLIFGRVGPVLRSWCSGGALVWLGAGACWYECNGGGSSSDDSL